MKYKSIVKVLGSLFVFIFILNILSVIVLPNNIFTDDFSTVVLDSHGALLGAKLANDQQWRFQPSDSIPSKFKTAIVAFEDKYFYYHPGINIFSIFVALIDNIKAKKIIRGGSPPTRSHLQCVRYKTNHLYKFITCATN